MYAIRSYYGLLQFTRQTDMLMVDEQSVAHMADCFLAGQCWFEPRTPEDPGVEEGGGAA